MTHFFYSRCARWSAMAAAAAVLAACGKGQQAAMVPKVDDKPVPVPVAIVDGNKLSRDEYAFFGKTLTRGKGVDSLTAEQKSQVLDLLIDMDVAASQAVKDGLDKDPETAAALHVTRLSVLKDAEEKKFRAGKEPTDQELHAEYDSAVAGLDRTEYHARHILVKDKDLADQLTKKLKAGAKFEDLAKANSIDTGSKVNGGDLGWFSLAKMVKPFSDAVKGLKKGDVTAQPVQTQFGWHIIQLEDTRETAPPPTFDQVKDQVKNRVLEKQWQDYINGIKKTEQIEKKL